MTILNKSVVFAFLSFISSLCFAQDSVYKYVFMGHLRYGDDDVLEGVANFPYDQYDATLLGGDVLLATSQTTAYLDYTDNIFGLSDTNTLFAIGNHDIHNVAALLSFTERPRYYAYYRDQTTFVVLDTEINTGNISGSQLAFFNSVCDTLSTTKHLVVIHHRIIWMVDNPDLADRLDVIGGSSKSLSGLNYWSDIHPQFQAVKNRGIDVLVLAGDRASELIEYEPEDSLNFIACGMRNYDTGEPNYYIEITNNVSNGKMTWEPKDIDAPIVTGLSPVQTASAPSLQTILHSEKLFSIQLFNPLGQSTRLVNDQDILWRADLSSGFYIYHAQMSDGQLYTGKVWIK